MEGDESCGVKSAHGDNGVKGHGEAETSDLEGTPKSAAWRLPDLEAAGSASWKAPFRAE